MESVYHKKANVETLPNPLGHKALKIKAIRTLCLIKTIRPYGLMGSVTTFYARDLQFKSSCGHWNL